MPDRRNDPPYDSRYDGPRDPNYDPRADPRFDPRDDPRFDPRDDPRYDPRFAEPPRGNGRADARSAEPAGKRSRGRTLAMLAALLGLILVALFAYRLTRSGPGQDRLGEGAGTGNTVAAADGADRCGTQRTYDLVKRELFRRAGQVRGSDQSAFDRLSAYAVVRVESPVLKRQDEDLGTQVCSGRVSIDLPPGVAVVGGRRTLTADADYALQPAADGSGDVVTLSGADAIIVPLATLARTGSQPGLPQAQQPVQPQPVPIPAPAPGTGSAPVAPAPPVPPAPPTAPRNELAAEEPAPEASNARPSFNCASARTRGEIAVCRSDRLATLDRRMAAEYFGAVRQASPEQRALLQRTRGTFLTYRDRCANDACIAGAYQDRIREIRDIINDRWSGR